MCVVIDANTVGGVFNSDDASFCEYQPLRRWVLEGAGCIVVGGKKYRKELRALTTYLSLFAELSRRGRIVQVSDKEVDDYAAALAKRGFGSKFNDEHIVAIVAVSRCRVVCTKDKSSYPFLRLRELYPKGVKPPSIYNRASHAKLCCEKHVVGACRKT